MVKLAQNLIRSSNSIKHICCYSIVLMCYNYNITTVHNFELMPNRINISCLSFLFAVKLLKSLIKESTLVHKIEPININQKLKAMCDECWGIYPCPICGTDEITEEDYERELDERLNEADAWFQQHLEEELPFE